MQRDVSQLRGRREGLPLLFRFRPTRKHFLDPEHLVADHVELPIAALRRMVSLREHRLAAVVGRRCEITGGPDDVDVVTAGTLVRLDDKRSGLQERRQPIRLRRDVRRRRRHPRGLQHAEGDDLVA